MKVDFMGAAVVPVNKKIHVPSVSRPRAKKNVMARSLAARVHVASTATPRPQASSAARVHAKRMHLPSTATARPQSSSVARRKSSKFHVPSVAMPKSNKTPAISKFGKAFGNASASIRSKAAARRKAFAGSVRKKASMGCDGDCGYLAGCGVCPVNPDVLDRLNEDEIAYVLQENPELMGAALKKLAQKAKKKVQKVVAKIKAAPKPVKALAAIAAAPLAPILATRKIAAKVASSKKVPTAVKLALAPLAPVAATREIAKKVASSKKVPTAVKLALAPLAPVTATRELAKKALTSKKVPKALKVAAGVALAPLLPGTLTAMAAKKAYQTAKSPAARAQIIDKIKKLPTPLKVAAGIALAPLLPATTAAILTAAPVVAPKLAVAAAIKKSVEAKQKREQASSVARAKEPEEEKPVSAVVPGPVAQQLEEGKATTAAMQQTEDGATEAETTEKKPGGLGALLPIAAGLALLPMIL